MKFNEQIGEKIKALAIELTQIRSVVGTAGEIAVAKKVYEYLAQLIISGNIPTSSGWSLCGTMNWAV